MSKGVVQGGLFQKKSLAEVWPNEWNHEGMRRWSHNNVSRESNNVVGQVNDSRKRKLMGWNLIQLVFPVRGIRGGRNEKVESH